MTTPPTKPYVTKTGRSNHVAADAPPLVGGPADVVPVRLDANLRAAVEARAADDDTTTSDVIREALRSYLNVA